MTPSKLNIGDTIGIIAPSGTIDEDLLWPSIRFLKSIGFSVVLGASVFAKNRYLAGSDFERVSDVHEMFENREIKAIFSARGGYGSLRILPYIDFSIIRNNPKILVGFSDTTALQLGIFAKTGLISYSGLLLGTDIKKGLIAPDLKEIFFDKFAKSNYPSINKLKVVKAGNASGKFLGGCLSLISSLIGTSFMPVMDNAILVVEDVNEFPYRIDRMFTQLKLAGILERINGLILGTFTKCGSGESDDDSLSDLFEEFARHVNGPVLAGLSYGHIPNRVIIPMGGDVNISTNRDQGKIEFMIDESVPPK